MNAIIFLLHVAELYFSSNIDCKQVKNYSSPETATSNFIRTYMTQHTLFLLEKKLQLLHIIQLRRVLGSHKASTPSIVTAKAALD